MLLMYTFPDVFCGAENKPKNFWICSKREWSFLFKAISKQSFTLLPVLHVLSFNIDTQNEASASVNPVINQGDKT